MQQVIYIDVLIFLNIIITFVLLHATGRLMKIYPSAGRMTIASLLGGFTSLIILAPEMGFVFSFLTKLLFSLIIVICAFTPRSFSAIARETAYFFAVNFIFAGIMLFASSLPGVSLVQYNNGAVYMNFSFFSLIASCLVCYGVTVILGRFSKFKGATCEVFSSEIFVNGKSVKCAAIADTGNVLIDPYTAKPLIVADKTTLAPVLPGNITEYFENGSCADAIKLIPCRTVSGSSLMPCFKADKIIIKGEKLHLELSGREIAVSNQTLAEIILPPSILSERSRLYATEK